MKRERKKHPKLGMAAICLGAALLITALVFCYFGGFGTGESADSAEFAAYAGTVEDIVLPESATVVALGEATHGNAEFQELKLDVFRRMVEAYGLRAFSLEGDYGGCEQVDRYIHGGEGTAREAAAAIGFALYRTDEMAELISWMREYNGSAAEGEDLRFYGFDMQRCTYNIQFLAEACKGLGIDCEELEKLADDDGWTEGYDTAAREEIISAAKAELVEKGGTEHDIHFADILLQNCALQTGSDAEYGNLRDAFMAENTKWIAAQEREKGHERIFVSAHNGHVGRFGYANMGRLLSDELGEAYYVIGTDFFRTRCNMPSTSNGKRGVHGFFSYDPLAKAAKRAGLDICWLDFDRAAQSPELEKYISGYNYMGSLGEGYGWYMHLLPPSYRIFQTPGELYDSMIFVADATPTDILPAE